MDARTLIMEADRIAREQGLNQKQWSTQAGHAESGQTVSRIISKGDCRLSTLLALLEPIGLELQLVESENRRAVNKEGQIVERW